MTENAAQLSRRPRHLAFAAPLLENRGGGWSEAVKRPKERSRARMVLVRPVGGLPRDPLGQTRVRLAGFLASFFKGFQAETPVRRRPRARRATARPSPERVRRSSSAGGRELRCLAGKAIQRGRAGRMQALQSSRLSKNDCNGILQRYGAIGTDCGADADMLRRESRTFGRGRGETSGFGGRGRWEEAPSSSRGAQARAPIRDKSTRFDIRTAVRSSASRAFASARAGLQANSSPSLPWGIFFLAMPCSSALALCARAAGGNASFRIGIVWCSLGCSGFSLRSSGSRSRRRGDWTSRVAEPFVG